MKLHKTLVQAVTDTLQRIFAEGVYADKAVEQVLKQDARRGSRDRRFIAATVYGMVRWWRLIGYVAEKELPVTEGDYRELFAAWLLMNGDELPGWPEFAGIDRERIVRLSEEAKHTRKYRESVPDWLDELGSNELGALWESELAALNREAEVVLRVNTLRTDISKVQALLALEQVGTAVHPAYPDALILEKRQSLRALKAYQEGLFEVQDASSQLVAPFMETEAGMTVIDACAGAGGKSLHLAALMKNSGRIISMDVEERKLQELQKRAARAGAGTIRTQLIGPQAIAGLKNAADRLLLDVPCSGLGVLRRNPDAKWKLTPAFMSWIQKTQQAILSEYPLMLRPGGLLIYATCSILPQENQQQVERFLRANPGFEFIADRKVSAAEGFDGFYMAKMRKNK